MFDLPIFIQFFFWDCPNDPESQHHGGYNLRHPKAWNSPRIVGLSQKPRTALGRWDWPKGPESQHHGGYFSILENHNVTVRWLWDSPRSPEQSLAAPILRILRLSVSVNWGFLHQVYAGLWRGNNKSHRLDAEKLQLYKHLMYCLLCSVQCA